MKVQKYASINGLRAISISLVVISHLFLQNDILKNYTDIAWLNPVIEFLIDGQLGVNVFFVISGFLITSLLIQEEINNQTISLKNFYIRRTLRIFPAYYTLLLVYFLIQEMGYINITNESWLTAITYTKYLNLKLDWYTGHAWSLSVEEQFYLLWPLAFISGKKFRKYTAIFLILITPFIRVYLHIHRISWMTDSTIFTRIDAIAMGCFFALNKDEIVKRLRDYWTKIFYFSFIALFFLRYFPYLADKVHLKFIFVPLGVNTGTIANLLIALILMYSIFGKRGIWFKILNLKLLNYIGLLSYSIYLWQQIFLNRTPYWINQFPQNIILTLLVSMGSYYLIEKRFLKLKSKFTSQGMMNTKSSKLETNKPSIITISTD